MRRYALWDDQWDRIEAFLPGRSRPVRVTAKDNRLFVEAALSRYHAAIPRHDLPEHGGGPTKVHTSMHSVGAQKRAAKTRRSGAAKAGHYLFNRTSF